MLGTTEVVISKRKKARIVAALALSNCESALRGVVSEIDEKLEKMSEKMAQLLAVASTTKPIKLPSKEKHWDWLEDVWLDLNLNSDTSGMYSYLKAALKKSDLYALLGETLDNLLDGQTMR